MLSAVMIAAPPLGGPLVQRWGPGFVFQTAGVLVLLLGVIGFAWGPIFRQRKSSAAQN